MVRTAGAYDIGYTLSGVLITPVRPIRPGAWLPPSRPHYRKCSLGVQQLARGPSGRRALTEGAVYAGGGKIHIEYIDPRHVLIIHKISATNISAINIK